MKKLFVFFFSWIFVVYAQNSHFTWNPENQHNIFLGSLDCIIGGNLKLTNQFANISDHRISVGVFSQAGLFIKNVDYTYSLIQNLLVVRINYTQDDDSIHYVVVRGEMTDKYGYRYNSYDYWVIKPKYPLLIPIIDSVYYCGNKVSFSFAALGLDEDSLYSYEVVDSAGRIILPRINGFNITLDGLLNDSSLFNKEVIVRGFYNNSAFKYKYSGIGDKIYLSEWKTFLSGPEPQHLKVYPDTESETEKLLLKLRYEVGTKLYIPIIKGGFNITDGNTQRKISEFEINLIRGSEYTTLQIEKSAITLNEGDKYSLVIEFTDQFNKISRGIRGHF